MRFAVTTIAALSGLSLHATPPVINPIPAQTVPCAKSLVVPVTAEGSGPLTFTATSSNPNILPLVRSGGPFLKIHVDYAGDGASSLPFSGDMVFHLFRDFTPKTASLIAGFAQAGFYDGLKFHRVKNIALSQSGSSGFIVQGGDPLGTGGGGPGMSGTDSATSYKYDNEFSAPLIFDGKGQLAMANSNGTANFFGSNGSQFFITEGTLRFLDFNHTIFGQLLRGFDVLDRIITVPTDGSGKPNISVFTSSASLVNDDTDAVLIVSATGTTPVPATVTLVARDALGQTAVTTFTVNAVVDTVNDPPILPALPSAVAPAGKTVGVRINPQDLEFDYLFREQAHQDSIGATYTPQDNTSTTSNDFLVKPGATTPTGPVLLGPYVSQFGKVLRTDPADRTVVYVGLGAGRLTSQDVVLRATPGLPVTNGVVATFSYGDPRQKAVDFTATINWGDGTPLTSGSDVTLSPAGRSAMNTYNLSASHTYARAGKFPLIVTIDHALGARVVAENLAIVTSDPLTVVGRKLTTTSGWVSSLSVATFSDSTSTGRAGDYRASINWGDGQVSPGTIRPTAAGFNVGGSHKYAADGPYSINTVVTKIAPAIQATGWSSVEVSGVAKLLPPFAQSHIVGQLSNVSKNAQTSSLSSGIYIVNSGNLTTKNVTVNFYLSDDAALNKPGDLALKVGTANSLAVGPIAPDRFVSGTISNLIYPAGTTTSGKYLLMELVNPDPIGLLETYDRVFSYGPLP